MSDTTDDTEERPNPSVLLEDVGPSLKRPRIERPAPPLRGLDSGQLGQARWTLSNNSTPNRSSQAKKEQTDKVMTEDDTLFFKGAIRHSHVSDRPSELSIKTSDLYMPRGLLHVTIICFFVELDFVRSTIPVSVPIYLATDARMSQDWSNLPSHWTHQPILMKDFQCMHTKITLMQYNDRLRFILTTSNFIAVDHEKLDNIFYIHDFLRIPVPILSSFGAQLSNVLSRHGVMPTLLEDLDEYDLSTCQVDLILSVPGTYYGTLAEHFYGLLSIPAKTSSNIMTDCMVSEHCTSSLGNLNKPWIQSFRNTLCGDPTKMHSKVSPENTKVLYASMSDVQKSTRYGGRALSDNIVCNGKFSDPTFAREFLHHYISRRQGTLYHAKSILVHDSLHPAYLVFGSHNFSQAAWGSVHVQGPRARFKGLKSVIANYEVSVLIPGHLIESMLIPGMTWNKATTYQQEALEPYQPSDRPHTIRINR